MSQGHERRGGGEGRRPGGYDSGRPSREPRGSGAPPAPKRLPAPRSVTYFQEGHLADDLMDRQAEEAARALRELSTTQLRRFYEDVLTLRERLRAAIGPRQEDSRKEAEFARLRADFKMLKAKAAYAHGRSPRTFPREFLQFFVDHVSAVNSANEFEAFCKHFQAVVAFHKFYGEAREARS